MVRMSVDRGKKVTRGQALGNLMLKMCLAIAPVSKPTIKIKEQILSFIIFNTGQALGNLMLKICLAIAPVSKPAIKIKEQILSFIIFNTGVVISLGIDI